MPELDPEVVIAPVGHATAELKLPGHPPRGAFPGRIASRITPLLKTNVSFVQGQMGAMRPGSPNPKSVETVT